MSLVSYQGCHGRLIHSADLSTASSHCFSLATFINSSISSINSVQAIIYLCPSGKKVILANKEKIKAAFKKIGVAGFLFFLIKGLIWLAIMFGATKLFD